MKFGEHLNKNKSPEYGDNYVNYDDLKRIIRDLEDSLVGTSLPTDDHALFSNIYYNA